MTEEEARWFFFIRAVELADPAEVILTREDRLRATMAALDQTESIHAGGYRRGENDEAFLVRRSNYALTRIQARFPEAERAVRRLRWPAWLNWLLPLAALVLGLATNELGDSRQLNIIAFPMLGMLAWNLVVFLGLAVQAGRAVVRRQRSPRKTLLARLVTRLSSSVQASGRPLDSGIAQFVDDWLVASERLTYSRASCVLHLAAAALAAGLILGMYARALPVEYSAGWESTLIDAPMLHSFLGVVLGPASFIAGIPLANLPELRAMEWSAGGTGANARPWLHLYAVTAGLFVMAPRLLLAGWYALSAARLSARFPTPGPDDRYVRKLIRSSSGGGGGVVRVVPYGFHPATAVVQRLQQVLAVVLGEGARLEIESPVDYGTEDEWLAEVSLDSDLDHLVILFNLAATPETENHGAIVAGVMRRLAAQGSGTALTVLVDQATYRERLSSQARAADRLIERRAAWESMLGRQGVQPTIIDSGEADSSALTLRLEGALLRSTSPEGRGAA